LDKTHSFVLKNKHEILANPFLSLFKRSLVECGEDFRNVLTMVEYRVLAESGFL